MSVRSFDGDDLITLALGSLGFAFGATGATIAAILRKNDDSGTDTVLKVGVSNVSAQYALQITGASVQIRCGTTPVGGATLAHPAADGWGLVAGTKANGTVTPRLHRCVFDGSGHSHQDGTATLANSGVPTGSARIGATNTPSNFLSGDVGIVAVWNRVLPDAELEDLVVSEQAWVDSAPVALWVLDQASTATAVEDDIGTADQTALTGTTVNADTIPWTGGGEHIEPFLQAMETDTALGFTVRRRLGLAEVTETDTAQPFTAARRPVLGPAAEADTAGALRPAHVVTLGQATETDSAGALTGHVGTTLGQAQEIDEAGALTASKRAQGGQAQETDTALPLTPAKADQIAQAVETDEALAFSPAKRVRLGQALEHDFPDGTSPGHRVEIGQAQETDTAGELRPGRPVTLGQAQETDSAGELRPRHRRTLGQALEADTALVFVPAHRLLLGQALEVDSAPSLSSLLVGPVYEGWLPELADGTLDRVHVGRLVGSDSGSAR